MSEPLMTQFTLPSEIIDNISAASCRHATSKQNWRSLRADSIDECREWTDKAAALASYARQADDVGS